MVNFNRFAPIIQDTYAKFEKETTQRQKGMEEQYLQIYRSQPIRAQELIQQFSDKMLLDALDMADNLTEELFTLLAIDTQNEYRFAGA